MKNNKSNRGKRIGFILSEARTIVRQNRKRAIGIAYIAMLIPISAFGIFKIFDVFVFLLENFSGKVYVKETKFGIAYSIMTIAVCFLFVSPLFTKIFSYSRAIFTNERPSAITLPYAKTLYVSIVVIIRFGILLFLSFLYLQLPTISIAISELTASNAQNLLLLLAFIVIILFAFSLYRLLSFSFVLHVLFQSPEISCHKARKLSSGFFRAHFVDTLMFYAKVFPAFFLCIISVGIYLIYFIPYFSVAFSLFSDYVTGTNLISREKYKTIHFTKSTEVVANEI